MQNEPRNNLKTVMAGLKNASPMKTREFGEASVTFQKFLKVQQEFELKITEVAAKCGVNKDELECIIKETAKNHYTVHPKHCGVSMKARWGDQK